MTIKDQKKTKHVSIKGETYNLVSAEAKKRGISIKNLMELIFKEAEVTKEKQKEKEREETVNKYWNTKF